MNYIFSSALKQQRLFCFASPNFCQKFFVHHHKEAENMERFLGIKRSNSAKANRNTHHNERKFRKVSIILCVEITIFKQNQNF